MLREGKELEMTVGGILDVDNNDNQLVPADSKIWLLQITGVTCHFSTIIVTKHYHHVNVTQFSLSFLDSFIHKSNTLALRHLFTFCNSIEALVTNVKNTVQWRRSWLTTHAEVESEALMTPDRPCYAPESTWFTLPRSYRTRSKIPSHTVYESKVGSSDSEATTQEDVDELDEHGSIQTEIDWLYTKTRVVFTTHHFHL